MLYFNCCKSLQCQANSTASLAVSQLLFGRFVSDMQMTENSEEIGSFVGPNTSWCVARDYITFYFTYIPAVPGVVLWMSLGRMSFSQLGEHGASLESVREQLVP